MRGHAPRRVLTALFDTVQARLDANARRHKARSDRNIGVRLRRCRGEAKLITGHDHETDTSPPHTSLLKALARAHDWHQRLIRGEARSIRQLADDASVTEGYVRQLLPLAGLAPDLVEAILDGSAPSTLTLDTLMRDLPLDWAEQRRKLSG